MNRDELIHEAAAAFDDTGALLVLADRLQLEGDPAGALIAHQSVPGKVTHKRMDQLVRASRDTWLAPLAGVIDPHRTVFRRGLPSRLALKRTAPTLRLDDPLWSIVETLDLDRHVGDELFPLLARMPRLRRLEGALPVVVRGLRGSQRPPGLISLGCHLGRDRTPAGRYTSGGMDAEALAVLSEDPGLVELRHGDLFEAADYRWLWRTPCGRRLARVSVSNINHRVVWGALAIGAWWQELQQAPAALQELELTEHDEGHFERERAWSLRFMRDAHGGLGALRASYVLGNAQVMDPVQRLANGLAELAPGSIRSFHLEKTALRSTWSFPQLQKQLKRLRCPLDPP